MLIAGLTFHVLTLVQNFYTPFVRDVLLQHGMADCAKQTCINILRKCVSDTMTCGAPQLMRTTAHLSKALMSLRRLTEVDVLPTRGNGRAIVLCVGGAREALLAEQDQFKIVLGRRLVGCLPARGLAKIPSVFRAPAVKTDLRSALCSVAGLM